MTLEFTPTLGGVLVGFSWKKADFTAYVFNPDASRPVVVLAAGVSF